MPLSPRRSPRWRPGGTRAPGGRGIPAASPGNKAAGGGGGGGGSHKPAQPQGPPGLRADGAPRREPGIPPVAHPPRHLPTQAVRAILGTHTLTHTLAHTRTGARFPLPLPETTGSSRARAAQAEQRQQWERGTHTRKHTHPRTAGQAEMCISGNLRPHSRRGEGKAQACAPPAH